jgi:hypothetical protein
VNTQAANFIDELRHDPELAVVAHTISCALEMIDFEADANPHAAALFEAISWILGHADRTTEQRLQAVLKLASLKGKVNIPDLRAFLGWSN